MEKSQVLKKQKMDDSTLVIEPNAKYETQILDSMEMEIKIEPKIEPIEIEHCSFEPDHNDPDQEIKLFEEANVIADNEKHMIDYSAVEYPSASTIEKILELENSGNLTDEIRLKIKKNGRPTPVLNLKQTVKDRGKETSRYFKYSMYDLCEWICGCPVKKAFFCFPCVLMSSQSWEFYLWTKEGVTDIKHLREKINKHALSPLHISNVIGFSCLGQVDIGTRLDGAYRKHIKEFNEKVTQNRYILSKIIDCIKFCGSFECALWGDEETASLEHPGMIFPGIIDFVSELDGIIREHLEKNTVFKGVTQTIRNDLLESILAVTQELIAAEVERAKFVAIQVDQATDTANKNQLVFIVRYVLGGNIHERFWKFIELQDTSAQGLSKKILTELDALKIGKHQKKLIAQCYDGANTKDVKTKIQNKFPAAHLVHCYAHHINLILQKAASQNNEVRVFFANLQGFSSFFGKSPKRTLMLDEVVRKRLLSQFAPIRWDFNTRCIETVFVYRCDLLNCLEELLTSEFDMVTINQADTLRMFLENFDFLYWLNFFHFVMPHVGILYSKLQKPNIDTSAINTYVRDFHVGIRNIRVHVIPNEVCSIARKKTEESKRKASLEICDIFLSEIWCRFESTDHLIIARLFNKDNFAMYKNIFPDDVLNVVKRNYPTINIWKLKSELEALYNRKEFYNSVSGIAILQLLLDMNLVEAFSESVKLLDILCTIPMATEESERCFSTLKRIKAFWRNTMGESRHTAFAMLSIEKPLIRSTHNFNELVVEHFAIQNERRIDLLYKRF